MNKKERPKKYLEKSIRPQQIYAIKISRELAETITSNPAKKKDFLIEIEKNIGTLKENTKTYADIISNVLSDHPKINLLNRHTLRCTALIALKKLLSRDEFDPDKYKEIVKKGKQGGGKRGVVNSHKTQGLKPFSIQEKEFLAVIGNNPDQYKKGSVRNISQITKELKEKIDVTRTPKSIEKYMRDHFTAIKKVIINREPKELKTLYKLYQKHYAPYKKLPIQDIANELNNQYNNNRTPEAIGAYIRNHWKTADEKMTKYSIKYSTKELNLIKQIATDPSYKHTSGQRKGLYNLPQIQYTFRQAFPDATRTIKAIRHQIIKTEKPI